MRIQVRNLDTHLDVYIISSEMNEYTSKEHSA